MGDREKLVIPQKYKDKYGERFPIWSFSKVSGIRNCVWEYYLGRILKMKGDNNIYSLLGSTAHDSLEAFYNAEIKYEDMLDRFESEFLEVEMSDYKFTSDEAKNDKMANDYKEDLINFFQTHKVIPYKVLTEKLIWVEVNEHVFLGYVDGIYKDSEGFYHILDWKTSTLYKGNDIYEHQKQLLLYALSLMQLGIPLENIKVHWDFLKYTNVTFKHMTNVTYVETTPKETKQKTSCCLKSEWVSKVKTQLKKDIITYYENEGTTFKAKELKEMVDECVNSNSLVTLPQGIRDMYVREDVVKTARRHKWVGDSPIQTQIKKDLKRAEVDDITIEMLLVDCASQNSLDPVKDKIDVTNYELSDAMVYGTITQETIDDLIKELSGDIDLINSKSKDKEEDWAREPIGDSDSFYCNVLCGHKKNCKYYKDYITNRDMYTGGATSQETDDLLNELNNL